MRKQSENYNVSKFLYTLEERQIATLDQEATNGEAWHLYCDSYITRPTVFKKQNLGPIQGFWGRPFRRGRDRRKTDYDLLFDL